MRSGQRPTTGTGPPVTTFLSDHLETSLQLMHSLSSLAAGPKLEHRTPLGAVRYAITWFLAGDFLVSSVFGGTSGSLCSRCGALPRPGP